MILIILLPVVNNTSRKCSNNKKMDDLMSRSEIKFMKMCKTIIRTINHKIRTFCVFCVILTPPHIYLI